jgi:biopolymer transport protein TolR
MVRKRRLKSEMNVVPYIDVMLVLLVIFMVAAPLINTGKIDLPAVGNSNQATTTANPIQINVGADKSISIKEVSGSDKQIKDVTVLKKYIQDALKVNADRPVVIAGDKEASYSNIMSVMDAIQSAKTEKTKVGLLVNTK